MTPELLIQRQDARQTEWTPALLRGRFLEYDRGMFGIVHISVTAGAVCDLVLR